LVVIGPEFVAIGPAFADIKSAPVLTTALELEAVLALEREALLTLDAFAPGKAWAWGLVRKREVAIALVAIRTICRRFRISEVVHTAETHQLLRPTYLGT
jgi:hypothetical protein